MILHCLSAAPGSNAYRDCLRLLSQGDALVLLADGVYAGIANTDACVDLQGTGAEIYLLQSDVAAAGILEKLASNVTPIDFDAFVALTERFSKQQAWY